MDTGPDFFLEVFCLSIYGKDTESEAIVHSVIETYKDEVEKGSAIDEELTQFYVKLITEVCDDDLKLDNKDEVDLLLLKFEHHPSIKDNPKILSRINRIIENRVNITDSRIDRLKVKIKKWLVWVSGNSKLKQLFRSSNKALNTSDVMLQDMMLSEMLSYSKDLTKIYEDMPSGSSSTIDFIDMTCKDSVRKGLASYKKKRVVKGYKLGLQGICRMFGSSGGPVPGEFGAVAALSTHYKSGLMMDFARWICIMNTPRVENEKPAAIVFISLENEIYENLMLMFKSAYYNHYEKTPDGLDDDTIIEEVNKIFAANGYKLLLFREDGEDFGYDEWKNKHEEIAKEYTINASITDYAGLMELDDNSKENSAKQRQQLVGKMKNYCNRSNIFGLTGLQLEGQAEQLANSGVNNIVKKFSGVHLADSKGVRRELDFLIFCHIETNALEEKFLTMNMHKHKYVHDTPPADKYCAYKLYEGIGLVDDINDRDMSTRDIYDSSCNEVQNKEKETLF